MLEREVKLRFDTPEEARSAVLAAGATPLRGRRLQEDCLLDSEDQQLGQQRSVLRIRTENGKSLMTFKGPVQAGTMKIREEHETVIGDGQVLLKVFEELGLHVWFRYEKYREEFGAEDVVIAVDETPIGTYVEIEGGEQAILTMTAAIGRTPSDFILDSYRGLFLKYRDEFGLTGSDMVFDAE